MSQNNKKGLILTLVILLTPLLLLVGYLWYAIFDFSESPPTPEEQKIEDAFAKRILKTNDMNSTDYRDDVTLEKVAKIQLLVDDLEEGENKRFYDGILTEARYYIINVRDKESTTAK